MSNSSLVTYTRISPNKTSPRNHAIDRITIHCFVGQVTVVQAGQVFSRAERRASCNYAVGYDGRIALIVNEGDRSWCSSSPSNDNRAITIEVASDDKHPYTVTEAAFSATIDLCEDICRRNGKSKLLWIPDKAAALPYRQQPDEMLMTVHRWFANKACPGQYLLDRHAEIAKEVTRRLKGEIEVITDRKIRNKDTGEIVTVKGIIKDGRNYIQLADLAEMGVLDVSYDAASNLAEVGRKK